MPRPRGPRRQAGPGGSGKGSGSGTCGRGPDVGSLTTHTDVECSNGDVLTVPLDDLMVSIEPSPRPCRQRVEDGRRLVSTAFLEKEDDPTARKDSWGEILRIRECFE